jgi:integrase
MPAKQRGRLEKLPSGRWSVRFYDENGVRQRQGGFETKTEAAEWLGRRLDEIQALRRGELVAMSHRPQTVNALLDAFLERHGVTVDSATKRKLERQLKHARAAFGGRHPDALNRLELEDWRQTLSPGSRHDVFRGFRQALSWAAARSLASRDASAGIRNPKRKRHERRAVFPFETWREVEAVCADLDARYRALPIVGVGCGLRPEELFGLHRADVDREANVVHVRRRFTSGELKPGTKTGPARSVPLRKRVLEALDAMPPRIDTPVLFPAPRGGYIDGEKFRHREWAPALRGAGIAHRRIYDMRHTFATWAIESGVQVSYLAVVMGTSIRELEDTYFRWLRRTDEQLRAVFDAYDAVVIRAGSPANP